MACGGKRHWLIRDGEIELSADLPTFGGTEIENTHGVWSWDDTRALVGTCVDDLAIVPRSDVE